MEHIEKVKEITRRLWDQQDIESIYDLVRADFNIESPVREGQGVACLSDIVLYWRSAFPDVKSEWLSADEVEPGKVVVCWEANGTHTGTEFFGIIAANCPVEYSGETTYLFNEGKLVSYEAKVDIAAIQAQLRG